MLKNNGLGDRASKTVGAVETLYTLDATGLTQVIAETTGGQTIAYLPGLAQDQGAAWAYYLPDALGSIRQLTGAGAQVTLARSYEPFGSLLEQAGMGASGFGFAGEQRDASTGLVFLRARYYDPALGRFVSKDPWSGSIARPQTQNGWAYVSNNPINQTDASGLCEGHSDWGCWAVYRQLIAKFPTLSRAFEEEFGRPLYTLPRDVLEAILTRPSGETIVQHSSSNVLALIRLFEADHLPGNNAQERLQWILNKQASYGITKSYMMFGNFFPEGDSGFCEELADQPFYENRWRPINPGPGPQMGHFLTAVALGFKPEGAYYQSYFFALVADDRLACLLGVRCFPYPGTSQGHAFNLIVGHEMLGDRGGFGQPIAIVLQYMAATKEARDLFEDAVRFDAMGNNDAARDAALREILISTDPRFRNQDAIAVTVTEDERPVAANERVGNSMQDLRLSVKGWRFGQEIGNGAIQSRHEAAEWLRREIYDASNTR